MIAYHIVNNNKSIMSIKPQLSISKSKTVIKLLMLGDVSVGKSSLLVRYADNKFQNNRITTIGIENRNVNINIEGNNITLQIWDTAGQEKWRQVPPSYYRGVKGIILVYDLSARSTFDLISDWVSKIQESTDKESLQIALVGNKSDLERQVQTTQGREFASKYQMLFAQTSAKTSQNVSELFLNLTKSILSKGNTIKQNNTILKCKKEQNDKKKDQCC